MRSLGVLGLVLATAACGPDTTLDSQLGSGIGDRDRSDFVRVLVEEQNGWIDSSAAHEEAADHCGQRLQTAQFFMAQDVGPGRRVFMFRCL